jgi:hypothetical protein
MSRRKWLKGRRGVDAEREVFMGFPGLNNAAA